MSQEWEILNSVLGNIFHSLNDGQPLLNPNVIWSNYQIDLQTLLNSPINEQLVEVHKNIWSPRSYEALRILANLRQRRTSQYGANSNHLVDQIRAETILRQRPIRNLTPDQVGKHTAQILNKPSYSSFQKIGWQRVWETIQKKDQSLIIVAPTGSGKTEVFLLPAIYSIAQKLGQPDVPRYVLIYPRVELLKDQVARVFKYAYRAEQYLQTQTTSNMFNQHRAVKYPFVIGLQFGGVRAEHKDTRGDRNFFDSDGYFQIVEQCPICEEEGRSGRLKVQNARNRVVPLRCDDADCGAIFHITIGKNDHVEANPRPHILITTIESLDRLYLNPKLEEYVSNIQGLFFDEVHLYHSLYGAHVHHVINRIENIQKHGQPLFKIASSATVSHPNRFAARLFYGRNDDERVKVHNANGYPQEPAGIETVIFLQTTESDTFPRTQSTLIQTVMAVGHGILAPNERTIVFTESIDHADRSFRQLSDAESTGQLWRFRILQDQIFFENERCPATSPALCNALYMVGECWRGTRGGLLCHTANFDLINVPLQVGVIHSKTDRKDYWGPDVIVATPVLEVGVDDERFRATIHYRPPRSVFSFLQRRGRAGRRPSDTAYTVLVLGRTPADEFYFRRRNRLMDAGQYELPLNPNNEVIREMHTRLEQDRQDIGQLNNKVQNIPKSILLWTISKYRQCVTLNSLFGHGSSEDFFRNIYENTQTATSQAVPIQQEIFKGWIRTQRDQFRRHTELDILLRELITRMPETERQSAIRFQQLIYAYRRAETNDFNSIKDVAQHLLGIITPLRLNAEDDFEKESYKRLQDIIFGIVGDHQQIGRFNADESLISALYDFFNLLYTHIIEEQFIGTLNRTEDMLKIVSQSLFYIGNNCLAYHPNCPACLPYFMPDAYFQEVKPITIETWTNRGRRLEEVHIEDATKLGTMLLPYKTFYRYFSNNDYMGVVRTTNQTDWIHQRQDQRIEVRVELHLEGTRRNGGVNPSKIHVVPIRPDREGQGIVKMCSTCYRLHHEDFNGRCSCGSNTIAVKLRSAPIIEREAEITMAQRLSDTFSYCDDLTGIIRIRGAHVEYSRQIYRDNRGYVPTQHHAEFDAMYYRNGETPEPIVYDIHTRGIIWNLSAVVHNLLTDKKLANLLKRYGDKSFDPHLVLHTAAHMLHKAIASISGVNDVTLEYAVLDGQLSVVIWERYEGGVGISEIIRDTILEEPKKLYRELLASALCPVFYSEDQNWPGSDETLRRQLMENWALTDDEDMLLVEGVVRETVAERQAVIARQAETGSACSITDGCPACIHVTVCTAELEQSNQVSRYVAEAIMGYFRLQVDNTLLNSMDANRFDNNVSPVVRLRDDIDRDLFDVVRF